LFLPEAPSLREVWCTDASLPAGDDRAWVTPLDLDAAPDPRVTEALLRAVEDEVVPADLAQVTYTSGSSADPKGVVHTHGTVVRATAALPALRTADGSPARLFCAFPFFWIGGTLILGGALQSGATVLVTERFDPGAALDLIEQASATHVLGWPTLLQAMRDHPSFASRSLPFHAGDWFGPAFNSVLRGTRPPIPAHRGMSETVGNIGSVGYRVVDPETGLDVPDGDEGELWVRGYGLMHGYYKQERADVFDADGWFHTGDRVFLHDGRAWFVGRSTEMVKSRGANVAPREVELFLEEEFDEVLYAFVLGLPHPERGAEVAAVLVPALGRAVDPDDSVRRARELISAYKVPTRIAVWDEADVPWLGSGKPDKRAIRQRLEARGC
jgi:acyl-CoA synthetase (AMP-forming)/AMP-acid ligase II